MATSADYSTLPKDEPSKSDAEVEDSAEKHTERRLDDLLQMGRYCMLILSFTEFSLIAGAGNMTYMMYAGAAPTSVGCRGTESKDICKWSAPANCTVEPSYVFRSVNVDFGFFCDDDRYVKTSISVQMTGIMMGTILAGNLSDRIGRLRVLSVCYVLVSLLSIVCSFSNSLVTFTLSRSLLGFFNGGLVGTYGVYQVEHVPKEHRFLIATIVSWAPNMMLLCGVAWLTHDWRNYQLAIFVLSSPAIILFFFVNESPRWLIMKGRITEAEVVLRRIQKIDGVSEASNKDLAILIEAEHQKQATNLLQRKNYDMRHLFSTRQMTIVTLVMVFGKMVSSLTAYGLMFNIDKLSGSIYINSLLLGAIRWVSNLVIGLLDFKFAWMTRKRVHLFAQIIIGFCLLFTFVVFLLKLNDEYSMVVRVSTLLAMSISSQVFITKSIATVEFYPTMVRNSAIAIQSVASRIGTIASPLLFQTSANFLCVPYALMSAVSFIDGALFQSFFPETKGDSLPDRIAPNSQKTAVETPLVESTPSCEKFCDKPPV